MSFTHQRSPVTIFMQAAEYEIAASLRSFAMTGGCPCNDITDALCFVCILKKYAVYSIT